MPNTAIDKIHEAEKEAENIRTKALEAARERIRSAEEEIALWKEGELKSARKEAREMVQNAEEHAESQAQKKRHQDVKIQNTVRQDAMTKMDKAVNFIVERIIKAK